VTKTLLLSTCNQVEIYAVVATFHDGLAKITDILAHQSAMTPDHLSPHLCVHHAAASIEHLFPVAAGRHLPGPVTNIRTGAFIPTLRETPITNQSTRR
jgi:hypothetical protein